MRNRYFHGILAGLLLWSLGTAGVCEVRCGQAPVDTQVAQTHLGAVALTGHAGHEQQPSHPAPARAGHCESMPAPPAPDEDSDCLCAATPGAPLQAKAEDGRNVHGIALLVSTSTSGIAEEWGRGCPTSAARSAPLATHQHRNPPLLI